MGGERPGRQRPIERYRSGYRTPAEEAYGEGYAATRPEQRTELGRERGAPRREGLTPSETGFDAPIEER